MIPFDVKDIKEILLKGGIAGVLIAWVLYLTMDVRDLNKRLDSMNKQMYELQNSTIKDNTRALIEFNLITKNK